MWLKQASIDNDKEVDERIASLLLRAISDSDDEVDYEVDGAAFDLSTCWSYTVDQTCQSSGVVGCPQPCFQYPVDPATTPQATASSSTSTDTVSLTTAPRRRRTRQPFSKAAIGLMKTWYDEHRSRPYASDAEVRQLAAECQLGVRQVQKWLSNRRRTDGNTRRRTRPAHNAKSRNVVVTPTTTVF